MNIFDDTLIEISKILIENQIKSVMTRYDCSRNLIPSDIDLLVPPMDYQKLVKACKKRGYSTSSHDGALGGRIKGMQINLLKPQRIKIDLHQGFTWRKSRYFDLNLIWKNMHVVKLGKAIINVPNYDIDAFIVLVNVIFEKTYINREDFAYLFKSKDKIFNNIDFNDQAKKYHWYRTLSMFKSWFKDVKETSYFPVFLPTWLILYSYLEKFWGEHKIDAVSFAYYIFFRIRYRITKGLPYE